MSWRLAPSTLTPMGIPFPSVNRLRLVPFLPRSVGFGPVPLPPERSLCHGSIHCLPLPIYPLHLIVFRQPPLPQLLEDSGDSPTLEPVMHSARSTERPRQRFPLAAGPQQVEDPIHTLAGRFPRPPALRTRRLRRQYRLNPLPQSIGNPPISAYASMIDLRHVFPPLK